MGLKTIEIKYVNKFNQLNGTPFLTHKYIFLTHIDKFATHRTTEHTNRLFLDLFFSNYYITHKTLKISVMCYEEFFML